VKPGVRGSEEVVPPQRMAVIAAYCKAVWWDKVRRKFDGLGRVTAFAGGFRAVTGCVCAAAYTAQSRVMRPSSIRRHVDSGTMVDTWATVGSGAPKSAKLSHSGGGRHRGVARALKAAR